MRGLGLKDFSVLFIIILVNVLSFQRPASVYMKLKYDLFFCLFSSLKMIFYQRTTIG